MTNLREMETREGRSKKEGNKKLKDQAKEKREGEELVLLVIKRFTEQSVTMETVNY